MLTLTLSEIAQALGGTLSGDDKSITAVSTDGRTLKGGELFVALVGERFDAHDFIDQVQAAGAAALLVSKDVDSALPQIRVQDTRLALGLLGQYVRDRVAPTVAALTGSCGKTTVKEMLAAILGQQAPVLYTAGNFNNDIGVPLTLLRLEPEHRFAVMELGANHEGEIAYTAALVRPRVALVNNVAAAHLEGFGTLSGVARAKGEIYGALDRDGIAVVNLDDDFAQDWLGRLQDREVLTFGQRPDADIRAEQVLTRDDGCSQFKLVLKQQSVAVSLPLPGRHNVANALAAAAMAHALGVTPALIASGLATVKPVPGRLNVLPLGERGRLIDDTYNASVGAVMAAIDLLAGYGGRRVLVLGDLGELGEKARHYHAELGRYAKEKGIDNLLTQGVLSQAASDAFGLGAGHFDDKETLVTRLEALLADEQQPISILVKGARSARMEAVVEKVAAGPLARPEVVAC
ncbi:UDP-N-acetylmuramoyl-tripeptide--D-alanyl-D-alanine ligase [Gallaecimonas sp. GXIMD4217]|uniref:UDP-N-acetylmuramoyl-tripeptide--D-alanyl-D- alanine ligase n=1 Tax=Gallaecimonas sp. GXIMD4217 TaxID=3131927 RepID=UPI00311AC464